MDNLFEFARDLARDNCRIDSESFTADDIRSLRGPSLLEKQAKQAILEINELLRGSDSRGPQKVRYELPQEQEHINGEISRIILSEFRRRGFHGFLCPLGKGPKWRYIVEISW